MKILYISYEIPFFPGGSGGQTREYHLLKELSAKHEIDFIGPRADGEILDVVSKLCRRVIMPEKQTACASFNLKSFCKRKIPLHIKERLKRYASLVSSVRNGYPGFVQQLEGLKVFLSPLIQHTLLKEKYDLVQIEHSNIAHWLRDIKIEIPKMLVAQNVKTIMWKRYHQNARGLARLILNRDYKCFHKYESEHLKRYDCVVAMSEIDKKYIFELCGADTPVFVVPNGVDTDYFQSMDSPPENPDEIMFIGTMNHPPNDEAALYFCDKMLPKILLRKPSTTFSVVGNSPSEQVLRLADLKNIRVTGFVPDSRPYFASASIVVVPLLSGSGTRLKILEAMSMGKAVVSTRIGAEGIEYADNENILIADDEASFIDKVTYLISNPLRRTEIGRNARRLAVEKYSWKMQAEKLDEAFAFAVRGFGHKNSEGLER